MNTSTSTLRDLTINLDNRPGSLANLGEALGRSGVSIEGGGAFVVSGQGVAHFLVMDAPAAERALRDAGIEVIAVREVVVQRLKQAVPGQLGRLCRAMGNAGVNIEVLYNDHAHQLIVVVDNLAKAQAVSAAWTAEAVIST